MVINADQHSNAIKIQSFDLCEDWRVMNYYSFKIKNY